MMTRTKNRSCVETYRSSRRCVHGGKGGGGIEGALEQRVTRRHMEKQAKVGPDVCKSERVGPSRVQRQEDQIAANGGYPFGLALPHASQAERRALQPTSRWAHRASPAHRTAKSGAPHRTTLRRSRWRIHGGSSCWGSSRAKRRWYKPEP
jgi:hypothetical protein